MLFYKIQSIKRDKIKFNYLNVRKMSLTEGLYLTPKVTYRR